MYDLIVIGGGPGGYVCAIRAAHLGGRVALVEEGLLGGTCLNRGCIPTKAFLESARRYREIKEAGNFGLKVTGAAVDFPAVAARAYNVADTLRGGVAGLLSAHGVDVKAGRGDLGAATAGSRTVTVAYPGGRTETLQAKNVVLATGSVPAVPSIPGANLPGVITSDGALALTALPESMVIIGGGVIGMEFASYLSAFGVRVTVLEALPQILAGQDEDVVAEAITLFRRQTIAIHTGLKVKELKPGLCVVAELPDGAGTREFKAASVLIATGRRPNLGGIDPVKAGIAMNGRAIAVDDHMRTSVPGLLAVGDLTGSTLAHAASAQGLVAAEVALGHPGQPYDGRLVPGVVYTDPEIACVGLTEAAARASGRDVRVVRFPFRAIGKALVEGDPDGCVKIVSDAKYGDLLGVHIVGAHAGEIIHEAVVALSLECTVEELAHMIHAHPTRAEAVMEAAHGLVGGFIHLARPAGRKE